MVYPPGAGTQLFDPRMSVKGPPPGRRRHDPQMASGGRDTTRRWSPRGGEDGEGRHDPRMGGHFPHQVLLPQEDGWIFIMRSIDVHDPQMGASSDLEEEINLSKSRHDSQMAVISDDL